MRRIKPFTTQQCPHGSRLAPAGVGFLENPLLVLGTEVPSMRLVKSFTDCCPYSPPYCYSNLVDAECPTIVGREGVPPEMKKFNALKHTMGYGNFSRIMF